MVLSLLANPPAKSLAHTQGLSSTHTSLVVAETGATDHMLPKKSGFISYYPVTGRWVCMGNNSFMPIAGYGTVISKCLHVPDLHNPLYSLQSHQRQQGCGFIDMFGHCMHVFFPTCILERLAPLPTVTYNMNPSDVAHAFPTWIMFNPSLLWTN